MKPKKWTNEERDYVKNNYLKNTDIEMGNVLGRTRMSVKVLRAKLGLMVPEQVIKKRISERTRTDTPTDIAYVKENYLKIPVKTMGRELGKSQTFVMRIIKNEGLVIPVELARQRKIDNMFKPGQEPVNKGKKITKEQFNNILKATKSDESFIID